MGLAPWIKFTIGWWSVMKMNSVDGCYKDKLWRKISPKGTIFYVQKSNGFNNNVQFCVMRL